MPEGGRVVSKGEALLEERSNISRDRWLYYPEKSDSDSVFIRGSTNGPNNTVPELYIRDIGVPGDRGGGGPNQLPGVLNIRYIGIAFDHLFLKYMEFLSRVNNNISIHNKGGYREGVLAFIPASNNKDILISSRTYNPLFLVVPFNTPDNVLEAASSGLGF